MIRFALRHVVFCLFVALAVSVGRADDILFIGNSFTYGGTEPVVQKNGGVPKLFEEIAVAKGKKVETQAVTAGGKDWAYLLGLPETEKALKAKKWTWVVLQDFSTSPTKAGSVEQFMSDGETFSTRIAKGSPAAGIVLYETWPRPVGEFYEKEGKVLSGPVEMMAELHKSYGALRDDLAAKNKDRAVALALVGTAFAQVKAKYAAINLDAKDQHHTTADGYYLAALIIYKTIYHESVKGASNVFFKGELTIPAEDATKLQEIADEVAGQASK